MGTYRRNKKKFARKYCTIQFYECIGLNSKGQGIVNFNNKKFNVNELLPGEKSRLLIYYEEQNSGEARAIELLNESPLRSLPLGHPKFKLGTYHIPHMTDEAQDNWKQERVNNLFNYKSNKIKVGKRKNYRNKIVLNDGGFFPPGRGRRRKVTPTKEQWDLMDVDFSKYSQTQGNIIIRRLDKEIYGSPGDDISTTHTLLDKKFIINLNSFYQVNNEMAKMAYEDIISHVNKNDIVYDLFGGAGIISIHISHKAKKVYSVEINKDSHKDALKNIEINNIKNIELICEDANKWIINNKNANVIIIDPTRSGISKESSNAINLSKIKKIIYLSCNIETQKRDIDLLNNYKIIEIQPYDFFPQTYHIENLIILKLK